MIGSADKAAAYATFRALACRMNSLNANFQ